MRKLADQMMSELQPEQASGQPITTVNWLDLNADQAPMVFDKLRVWMTTILAHYPRTMELLRPCWYRHPAVVQALLDLRAAWLLAYRNPNGAGIVRSALDWSHRHLPDVEKFVAREMDRCTSSRHDPKGTPTLHHDEQDIQAYLGWWLASRDPATEPPAPGAPA